MKCEFCGHTSDTDFKFCPQCGAEAGKQKDTKEAQGQVEPKPKEEDRVVCPKCGSENIHFVTVQEGSGFDRGNACCGYLLCGPLGLLCGVKDDKQIKTVRKCMKCGQEF